MVENSSDKNCTSGGEATSNSQLGLNPADKSTAAGIFPLVRKNYCFVTACCSAVSALLLLLLAVVLLLQAVFFGRNMEATTYEFHKEFAILNARLRVLEHQVKNFKSDKITIEQGLEQLKSQVVPLSEQKAEDVDSDQTKLTVK